MTTLEKVLKLIDEDKVKTGLSDIAMDKAIGLNRSSIANWRLGRGTPSTEAIVKIASYFHKSTDYLLGRDDPTNIKQSFSENEMYSYPVIGTICAGYDGNAEEEYTGEDVKVAPHLIKTRNPDDYFVLEVKGDSMFPLLQEGDKVLIRRCDTVDSGTVAAVGFNGEQATVKKIEYIKGENWMRLVPRNPDFDTVTIRDADLEQCRIYGEVVYLFRDRIHF